LVPAPGKIMGFSSDSGSLVAGMPQWVRPISKREKRMMLLLLTNGFMELSDFDGGVWVRWGEMAGSPSLYNATIRSQFESFSFDITIPSIKTSLHMRIDMGGTPRSWLYVLRWKAKH